MKLCSALRVAVVLFASLQFRVSAQTPTGSIEGTVTDSTGGVLAAASVTIRDENGLKTTLLTNQFGLFSARNLLPGLYAMQVEKPGFETRVVEGITVRSGQVVNGDLTLELGRIDQVVHVAAQALVVDASRHIVDTVIEENEIRDVPLFNRNFLDLAVLAAGVVIREGEIIDPTKARAYRAVGVNARGGAGTRIQIDGIDVTDESVGTTTANLSSDAVSEFQLTRSSLDISTSLTSSGAINIISRSGGNHVHGLGFWDYYNQDMGARMDYNASVEPYHRKRAGASVGGPFAKDRLFGFGNWERHYQTEQLVFTAPPFPQLNVSQAIPINVRYAKGRVDWNAAPAVHIFYSFQHDWNLTTGGEATSPFQNVNWANMSAVGLNMIKGRTTHSFRFGYVNFNNRIQSQELSVKFPTVGGVPYFLSVGPFQAGPNRLAPQATYQDNFQNSYDGSFLWGRHTLRFGVQITRIVRNIAASFTGPLQVEGAYDSGVITQIRARGGNVQDPLEYPLNSFLTGPTAGYFTRRPSHGQPHGGYFNTRAAWFGGDSLKLARHLTINLGLRWEYDTGNLPNDPQVHRDPALDTWIRGASQIAKFPKDLISPSVGFAWNPGRSGKTVIRGGFYKAYENNAANDDLFMLPPGLGTEFFGPEFVAGPDGTPINIDGKHPEGDYSDLIGRPIRDVIGLVGSVHQSLQNSYTNYRFDPTKGPSQLVLNRGGILLPGNQFKIPYAVQFNIGVQRELRPGTILSVDYVVNHGVGLPAVFPDFELRRDATTLDAAAARAQWSRVLSGRTVDEWIAANPTGNISAFGLVNDGIWRGLTPDFTFAAFQSGGFSRYRGLQFNLRGTGGAWKGIRQHSYTVSYALARNESIGITASELASNVLDNRAWNRREVFGPNLLDFTHNLSAASVLSLSGGVRIASLWAFRTAQAQSLIVSNLSSATSGVQGVFSTDLNGDGGLAGGLPRPDLLPGLSAGQFGRSVKSFHDLNRILENFNQTLAGRLTPHGQALVNAGLFTEAQMPRLGAVIPAIPLVPENNPNPWHNLFVTDIRFERPIKWRRVREDIAINPFVDLLNLFNHAPAGVYGMQRSALGAVFGSLNFDYAAAPAGARASDLNALRHRLNNPRKIQVGVRVDF
jgi:hypothetical protein